MKRLICELKHEEQKGVQLMVDNQSAITLSKNPIHHNRTSILIQGITSSDNVLKTRT